MSNSGSSDEESLEAIAASNPLVPQSATKHRAKRPRTSGSASSSSSNNNLGSSTTSLAAAAERGALAITAQSLADAAFDGMLAGAGESSDAEKVVVLDGLDGAASGGKGPAGGAPDGAAGGDGPDGPGANRPATPNPAKSEWWEAVLRQTLQADALDSARSSSSAAAGGATNGNMFRPRSSTTTAVQMPDLELSGKLNLALRIIAASANSQEKVVLFSKSLDTLSLIEQVLNCDSWGQVLLHADMLNATAARTKSGVWAASGGGGRRGERGGGER